MASLVNLASSIITPVYNLTLRHAVYLFKAGRNVEDLKEATEDLLAKSEDVQNQIEVARRRGMSATNEVRRWQQKVHKIKSEKEIICGIYDQRYKIFGCCSFNLWSTYNISKNASEKVLHVKDCLSSTPSEIAVQQMPPAVEKIPCLSTKQQSTRAINLQKALKCIKNKPVGMIGIWGPGGVGKTHLLKNINNSFVGDSSFDHVIFVTASTGCSAQKIQARIVKKLGLQKDDDVESQASIISEFLKERNFLILLDDLWERIDLQAVGIPYPLGSANQPKRKVVLTTRSKKVCGEMEVREEIKVACLREDEAWQLFQEKVGQKTLSSSPRIKHLARELVKELKGLPLALVTIGRAMYPKSDPGEWEFAIHVMRNSCRDKDDPLSMESVFRRLKFSYDSLRNDTLRQCFLTCAIWPEDWLIDEDDLARRWMGLGLVDESDIQSSYGKAHSLIGDLKAACLLESCEYLDKYWDDVVKMHDVVRDMALWISCGSGENNDKWVVHARVGTDLSRNTIPWSKAECVSLMDNAMEELPPFGLDPCPTKLTALHLQYNNLDHMIFETIKNFTALTYLDLTENQLKNIPDELCALVNLEYLDLSHNCSIYEVPSRFANLVKLKFLYLRWTCIRTIPKEVICSLKALQVFELSNTLGKRGHANYVTSIFQELGTLANLKAVAIDVEGVAEYELLSEAHIPIRSLGLQYLEEASAFCLSGGPFSNDLVRRTLHDLAIKDSTMEQIIILVRHEDGEPNFHFDALVWLRFIRLRSLRVITWKGISPKDVFPRLTCLDVAGCDQLQHVSFAMYLPCLERLEVLLCGNMKQAFWSIGNMKQAFRGSMTSLDTFPCLKFLSLEDMPNLTSICNSNVTFPSLVRLDVGACPNLKGLPFRMQNLPRKLQELRTDSELWNRLEWGEEGVKSFLQHRRRSLPISIHRQIYEHEEEGMAKMQSPFILESPPWRQGVLVTSD